jgi:phosphatidylserine decarboxylase
MQLSIYPTRLVGDLQREFNHYFPFLKLEFFRKLVPEKRPDQQALSPARKLAECQGSITDGQIELNRDMTVKDLERIFREQYSMQVQVYRRSGNVWLQTTISDNWTLGHQDQHGREISETHKVKISDTADFDLERDAES